MKNIIKKHSSSCLNLVFVGTAILMLNGCGVRGINKITPTYVSQYNTFYAKSINCIGKLLPQSKKFKYTGMIASFLDKTGKGSITTSKPITQGAADLAADSLAKFKFFKVKTAIPHNFRDNPQIFEFNKAGTDFFIHGSIVTLESTQDQRNLSFSLDPVNVSHKVTRVLAIVHMSINSSLDNTVFVNESGELASGNFKSEWDIFENEYGIFRTIGDKGIVLNGAIKMSQVADLALHEAIERGMVELVGRMFDLPYGRCLPKRGGDFSLVNNILGISGNHGHATGVAVPTPQPTSPPRPTTSRAPAPKAQPQQTKKRRGRPTPKVQSRRRVAKQTTSRKANATGPNAITLIDSEPLSTLSGEQANLAPVSVDKNTLAPLVSR